MPVTLDRLKALESFALDGRKTGEECRALTPIMDQMSSKANRNAGSYPDENTCPGHRTLSTGTVGIYQVSCEDREYLSQHRSCPHLSCVATSPEGGVMTATKRWGGLRFQELSYFSRLGAVTNEGDCHGAKTLAHMGVSFQIGWHQI